MILILSVESDPHLAMGDCFDEPSTQSILPAKDASVFPTFPEKDLTCREFFNA